MDALRRKAVVRESDVFAALFPRSFTPQHKSDELSPTTTTAAEAAAHSEEHSDDRQSRTPMPKLGALSPKTPKSLMASLPMTATDCAVVWKFLCDWVTAQMAMEAPASIPGLGTVTMRTQALKIRIAFFEPDPVLIEKNGLRIDGKESKMPLTPLARAVGVVTSSSQPSSVLAFNFLEMASCCGKHVEPAKAKEWLETVVRRLGDAMRQCPRVEFDLGVGVVVCANKVIDPHMLPRHTNSPSTIPFEIRTGESAVKRSLLGSGTLEKASKPTSFLTSSNFSPGIRVNAAIDRDQNTRSDLFSFDGTGSSLRTQQGQNRWLASVVPSSPNGGAVSFSPRTQRLLKQPQATTASQTPQSSVADAVTSFPSLFDAISRTYCVEPDLNLATIQPSNRIASNYTAAAAGLMMVRPVDSSRLSAGYSIGLVFAGVALPYDSPYDHQDHRTTSLATSDNDSMPPDRAASEERYFAYLDESNRLMDPRWLAPLAPTLVDRIVTSAVKYLSSSPSGHMKRVLDAAQDEFVSNYNVSVKKAIMDYLLLRRASRERLGITHGTPPHTKLPHRWQWGDSRGVNGCMGDLQSLASSGAAAARPFSPVGRPRHRPTPGNRHVPQVTTESSLVIKKRRRKRIKMRLQATFMLSDMQIRALHYMWHDFQATLSLVKLPDAQRLSEKIDPMQLHLFEKEQLAHASQMKTYLMDHWYHRTRQMFEAAVSKSQRELSPFATLDVAKLKHLFDAVAVQMSLQLRSLLLKSIREYVNFFELFGAAPAHSPSRDVDDDAQSIAYSALLLSLTLRDGDIQFKTPLVEIPSMLLGVLHNLPQLFHNTPRVENQFESSLEPLFTAAMAAVPGASGQRYSPFLWNLTSQEEEVVVATMRIREIVERNMTQLHALHAKYTLYSSVFREISTVDGSADDESSDTGDGFDRWRQQLERVRVVAQSMVTGTRTVCHLTLFSVNCQHVNRQLLAGFSQWTTHLLKGFADRTAAFNAQLRQQYKDVAARLAKRPLDLYDLVDAEEFVEQLKCAKLRELQAKVEGIKQRMQFLLFHRESVHVDGGGGEQSADTVRKGGKPPASSTASSSSSFTVPPELLASTAKTIRWRTHIERLLQDAEAALVGERARIEAVFLAKRNRFHAEIEEFDAEVKSFSKKGDLRHAATYVVQLAKMKDVLGGFRRQMASILDEEAKLQWKQTDFSKLDDIAEEMEPFEQLWKTAREFRELNSKWLRTNVFELQAHDGLKSLQSMMATISTVSNQLHLNSAAAAITAEMIKKQMSDFRENAKLVAAILNPSVQERHLKEMSTLLALAIDPHEPITLLKLLENGAYDHLPRIVEISENATMEKQIEDALRLIRTEWHGVQFGFKEATGSTEMPPSLIKGSVEEIKLLIEDHQLRLQALQCLSHAVPFFREINEWLEFLRELFTIADLSVTNKRLWKKIAPLFAAKIIDDAAQEAALFGQADRLFRSTTWKVALQPVCLELVPRTADAGDAYTLKAIDMMASYEAARSLTVQLLNELRQCHDLLEKVKDNVSVGLESRRAVFPRFYLLSDSELVTVLATRPAKPASDTTSDHALSSPDLWRYLGLCFPGIRRVSVNAASELTGFFSAVGEQVPIGSPIATADVPIASWLGKLETVMVTILQACTRTAISDFTRKEFRKWCLLWPEQVLCTTIQYAWTMQGEINNKKPLLRDAKTGWQAEVQVINDRIDAVMRELKAAATPGIRLTLSNVILLLHQLRDVSLRIVEELNGFPDEQPATLTEDVPASTVPSVMEVTEARESVTWLCQPRVYYDGTAALGVKMMSYTPIPYGYEYVGNASPAICITPLTLRCFHAIAFHAGMLNKGSIVHGAAGSGKKTTYAALARLCGRLLIHFEHQDQCHLEPAQRFHALMQFLKATVACGAWLMVSGIQHLHAAHYASTLATVCAQILENQAAKFAQCTVLGAKIKLKRGVQFLLLASTAPVRVAASGATCVDYLRAFFRPIQVASHDLEMLAEFFLEQAKMMHKKTLAKLITTATQVISRESVLLGESLQDRFNSARALREIVTQAALLSAQERTVICSAHGWPPQGGGTGLFALAPSLGSPVAPVEKEMPIELVRDLERMEIKAVCLTLREMLGSIAPASVGEWIDQFIRDFLPNSRELRGMRSFVLPASSARDKVCGVAGGKSAVISVEDRIQHVMKHHADASGGWGSESLPAGQTSSFPQKVTQLHHAIKTHSVAVVVGDIQSGKSAVWGTLAATLTRLFENSREADPTGTTPPAEDEELVRMTHTVVLHPRALTLDQLFGVSSLRGDGGSHDDTVLTRQLRDAKTRGDQTWLVLDGDIHASWADAMLQLVETRDTDTKRHIDPRSRLPGLLPPSHGRRMMLPRATRVIFETTTLEHISPSFLSQVSVVHVGGLGVDPPQASSQTRLWPWRQLYRMWKLAHSDTFAALHDELFSLLDVLMDETMDASLEFVAANFERQPRSPSCVASLSSILSRLRAFLALLHSFLLQSWAKLSVMVSGKQRKTAMHCYFLQAMVWGIGHTSDATERHKFHTFLRQWIINGPRSTDSSLKRVLTLFFPSGTMGTATAGMLGMGATQRSLDMPSIAAATANKETLYSFCFSVELGCKWMRWPEFYDAWVADQCQFGGESLVVEDKSAYRGVETAPGEEPVENPSAATGQARRLDSLFVRTPNMAAAVYLLHHLMASGYSGLLCGPRDIGKSTCARVWMELHALFSQLQRPGGTPGDQHQQSDSGDGGGVGGARSLVPSERIYVGGSVKARHILEQLAPFIEQRRVRIRRQRQGLDQPTFSILSSTLVFIDDLHRAPPDDTSDSALELLRGILEHEQLVHPTANVVMPCAGELTPFAVIQDDGGGRPLARSLRRVLARFIPIALVPCTDMELSTICSAFVNVVGINGVTSGNNSSEGGVLTGGGDASYSPAVQEAHQLVSMLIKATIKLYRTVSSDHWTVSPASHVGSAGRVYAATIAFEPAKAHYLFHFHDVLRVLRSVCGDTKQTLSMTEKLQVAKLWCHESARVFGDRLSDESDQQAFYQVLYDVACSHFSLASDAFAAVGGNDGNHASSRQSAALWLKDQLHFSFIGESSGAGMVDGYREVHELHKIELSIERTMMAMYRANIVTESIPLVLCNYAIQHILKLTRVLRHPDQHLLLIGAQGSKMRTITRLAASICRRSTTSFYVPRAADNAMDTWIKALKTALLHCVRQSRDEHHVLIVKDMHLENVQIYAVLDRYLSGSKLLSDVITYEDFDEPILQTLREEAERERRAGAQDLALSMRSKSAVVEYFFTLVRRRLQLVLVICLPPVPPPSASPSLSPAGLQLARFLWQYPHIQKQCAINWFGGWPEESLHVIAQKCFAPMFATDRERLLQLSQIAVQIYQRTRSVWPQWAKGDGDTSSTAAARPRTRDKSGSSSDHQPMSEMERPSAFILHEPSQLIEQISLFLAHWPRLQQEVETNKAKYTAGLEFMERTEQIVALEQTQLQLLQPEMEKKSALTRRMSGNLEKHRLAAAKLNQALEMETALVETQRNRLAQVEAEYNELIHETRTEFEAATAVMEGYRGAMLSGVENDEQESPALIDSAATGDSDTSVGQPSDSAGEAGASSEPDETLATTLRQRRRMIHSFVSLPNPATSLRQLAECIGLIFAIEPVEARDELDPDEIVMDYWGSVTAAMQTPQFWHELIDLDVRKRMTEAVLARVLPICTAPEFDRSLFAGIHELAALLCEWVRACASYAKEFVLAEPKYAQLCQERTAYDAAVAQLRKRQTEINVQANTTTQVTAMRSLTEQERREIEDKLRDNTSMLQMTTSVWKVLEPCKVSWRKLYEFYTQFSVQAMGDLMLATATMVYASSTSHAVHRKLHALWSEELHKHYLMHAQPARPLHEVFLVDDRSLTRWQIDGLPRQDPAAVESAVLVAHSFLFPVLIDPHRVATAWLKRQCARASNEGGEEKQVQATVVNGSAWEAGSLWESITHSVRKKRPVIIEDLTEAIAVELQCLLQSKRRARFDAVNRDVSSIASTIGVVPRRMSSVGGGLSGADDGSGFGGNGNHRCWFQGPSSSSSTVKNRFEKATIVECGSEACRVYAVYSASESIPAWLASLAAQVSLIRVDFSPAFVREKALRVLVDAHGAAKSHALMEIQTLQFDIIACDEQIETIEHEILDFFSVEEPLAVYSDTAKALKVVGNRSALHTLESSKLDSVKKIQRHYLRLSSYGGLIRRCLDHVQTWRDTAVLVSTVFPVEWIWMTLAQTVCEAAATSEDQQRVCTSLLRQCISSAHGGSDLPMVFDVLLSLRVHDRRRSRLSTLAIEQPSEGKADSESVESEEEGDDLEAPVTVTDVLPRLVQLLECKDDAQVKTLCVGVSSKLLTLRPSDLIPIHKWRAACYLAERHTPLRDLLASQSQHGGKEAWREALALDQLLEERAERWSPRADVDAVSRLGLVAAWHKTHFYRELEELVESELASTSSDAGSSVQHEMASDSNTVAPLPAPSRELKHEVRNPIVSHSQALGDLWRLYSTASTPLILISRPECEFQREIESVVDLAKASIDATTTEAETDGEFEKRLVTAIQKGWWIAIAHIETRPQWLSILSKVMAKIQFLEPHADFRLLVSTLDTAAMPLGTLGSRALVTSKSTPFSFIQVLHTVLLSVPPVDSVASQDPTPVANFVDAVTAAAASSCASLSSQLIARFCLLHAALTCSDHLDFAPWRHRGQRFGDDMLQAVLKAFAAVVSVEGKDSEKLWALAQQLVQQTYGAALQSTSEQLLLDCCMDLLLTERGCADSDAMDAALRTIPEIASVARSVDGSGVGQSILHRVETMKKWNQFSSGLSDKRKTHLHSKQLYRFLRSARRVLEYRGLLATASAAKPSTAPTPATRSGGRPTAGVPATTAGSAVHSTALVLDTLARFMADLAGYVFDDSMLTEKFPCDYKRPLNQLLRREVEVVKRLQYTLVQEIRHLQAVACSDEAPSPIDCEAFTELMKGDTPRPWIALIAPSIHVGLHLDVFQLTVLERIQFFHSWLESGVPTRLAVDKFDAPIDCILETLHHHLVRNLVGSMHCSGAHDCLRIVRVYEDRPQISLPARDETFYLNGWRLYGHLQLDIRNANASAAQSASMVSEKQRKRSQTLTRSSNEATTSDVLLEGTPVIVEVTSLCLSTQPASVPTMATSGSARQLPLLPSSASSAASSRRSSIAPSVEFPCPVFTKTHSESGGDEDTPSFIHESTRITISSSIPLPQLVLGGSSLQINTLVEAHARL